MILFGTRVLCSWTAYDETHGLRREEEDNVHRDGSRKTTGYLVAV